MDSFLSIKFNSIFNSLFPDKAIIFQSENKESRFILFFKKLKDTTQSSPSHPFKISEKSPQLSPTNNQDLNSSQMWTIDLAKILSNEDPRTTLMIKNIPNKFSREKIIKIIDKKFKDSYDLIILPTDSNGTKNFGYAFINLKHHFHAIYFYQEFHGNGWAFTNSQKVCEIFYSKIQGSDKLINHYPSKHVYINEQQYDQYNRIAQLMQVGSRNIDCNLLLSSFAYKNQENFYMLQQSALLHC